MGHEFANATCTTPKTCTVCKAVEGEVAAHEYALGKCAVCGVADPAAVSLLSSGSYGVYEGLEVDDKEGMLIRYTIQYNGSSSVVYSLVQYEEVTAAESEIEYNGKHYKKWIEQNYDTIKNVKITDNALSFDFSIEGAPVDFSLSFEYKDGAFLLEGDFGNVITLTRKE